MIRNTHIFYSLSKSKFVRSISLQILAIFIIVGITIVAIVFFSFSSEINKNLISDRQKQLAVIEESISKRTAEISSIAYNVSEDPAFYTEPVSGENYSGYEMAATLERYLVGNNFIEYLAYYRLSEPDKLYTSKGEISFIDFWSTYLGLDEKTASEYINKVKKIKSAAINPLYFSDGEESYFAYVEPIPQFSNNPRAFVLMLIPMSEVNRLLEVQLLNSSGQVLIFDSSGEEIYKISSMDKNIHIDFDELGTTTGEEYKTIDGEKYLIQKQMSDTNSWTYVSVIQLKDMVSGLARKQLVFIVLLLLLMFIAIIAMLICIIIQYKPIRNLAVEVTGNADGHDDNEMIDERALLSSTFASLKDDSEQKEKFETAYYEADAANKAKSIFLSNMSHDIRTPMNAIIGMTAIASSHSDDPVYVKDCLQKVQIASKYLLDIINNVLDMSRIESGKFTLSEETVELPGLIKDLQTILSQSTDVKNQHLIFETNHVKNENVIGDGVRLMQVFINIMSNSVKFTPNDGTIKFSMTEYQSSESGYSDYVFQCSDTGIGMSEDFISHVFDAFSRATNPQASKSEGTGLGMSIAKNLVELMGGTIQCESELGKGTTFTVRMRMKIAETASTANPVQPPADGTSCGFAGQKTSEKEALNLNGKRILVAEDNEMNREIACRIISETNAETIEASDGREAVKLFIQNPLGYFDLILMDIQMPDMDGYEATQKIRAIQRDDALKVPIYAMTANTFDEDVDRVFEAGMNGHLGKPYMPDELYELLRKALL